MSSYLIDRVEDIAARLKEIEADKDLARTGSSAPVTGQEPKTEDHGYGYGAIADWRQNYGI